MLMRIGGGSGGIREYLETGKKADREYTRDELDERFALRGDLDFADQVINTMPGEGEKYLHITLSFREDEVRPETMAAIVDDFHDFAFSAYGDDEYASYAEAHYPRIKSYTDAKTGELIERKPHVHILVPKVNLMTGNHLNPFGMVEHQEKFLEAFQEHINEKYGLASPKDNRRAELTPASELISRYKGDNFKGAGRELKAGLVDEILSRDVQTVAQFDALLAERGEVRTRNAGRDNEYRNLKEKDAPKGVNLKEYVFSKEFIELPTAEKRAFLNREAASRYETPQDARKASPDYAARLRDWRDRRAPEIKYLNSGNRKEYAAYKAADPDEKKAMLDAKREAFYQRWRPEAPEPERLAVAADKPRTPKEKQALRQAHNLSFDQYGDAPSARTLKDARRIDERMTRPRQPEKPLPDIGAPASGRQPNSMIERYAGELRNDRAERSADRRQMDTIKQELSAERLLAHVSHTHGVIPEKYTITQSREGGDRIRCGTRNLNVSDFLTKELNLPWRDAEGILRECYDRQQGREATTSKRAPRRDLWRRFQNDRPAMKTDREKAWGDQVDYEKQRRRKISDRYKAQRSHAQSDRSKTAAERRAAVSVLRMERLTADTELKEVIGKERDALRAEHPATVDAQYSRWLRHEAGKGDTTALDELRRREQQDSRQHAKAETEGLELRADSAPCEIPFLPAPAFSYKVSRYGDVTYTDRKGSLLSDRRDRVSMLRTDDQAIAIGLKLASQKFYNPKNGKETELDVRGSHSFRKQAVEVAVREGISVRFTDRQMESYRQQLMKAKEQKKARPERTPQKPQQEQKPKAPKPKRPRRDMER